MSKKTETPPEPNPDDVRKTQRSLRCDFTKEELLELGKKLAEAAKTLQQHEADKKRVVSDFTAKISACESEVTQLSNSIASGYEFRMVDCEEHLGTPKKTEKTVMRIDTEAVVAIEKMTADEIQRRLDFEKEKETPPAK